MNSNMNSPMIQSQDNINDCLMDTVSDIKFGNNDVFATTSWDGYIRFYQIHKVNDFKASLNIELKLAIDCKEPVLSLSWKRDMSMVFAALADNTVRAYDIKTSQNIIIGMHDDAPARQVFWNENMGVVISLGLDKKLKLWQLKQPQMNNKPQPIQDITLTNIPVVGDQDESEKYFIYADMDQKLRWLQWDKLAGNINSALTKSYFDSEDSKLGQKSQISSISFSYDSNQVGYSSVDGRSCVVGFNERQLQNRIVFKSHKTEETNNNNSSIHKYYNVSSQQFNRRNRDWLATSGSDGCLSLWDLSCKNKINTLQFNCPVVYSQVSPDGYMLAYATGNDWGMGLDSLNQNFRNQIGAVYIEEKFIRYK